MGHETLIMCVAMFYIRSHLAYLFNYGENKKPIMHHFGVIFGGNEFTQMTNNF